MASYWACWPRCGGINAADLAAIVPPGFHANIVGLGTAPFAWLFGVTVSDRRSTRQAFLHDPRVPPRGLFYVGERWLALIYFVCCGVGRLARFNVTAEKLSEGSGKVAYFEGTPIPASVLLTGVLAFAAWRAGWDQVCIGARGQSDLGTCTRLPCCLYFPERS